LQNVNAPAGKFGKTRGQNLRAPAGKIPAKALTSPPRWAIIKGGHKNRGAERLRFTPVRLCINPLPDPGNAGVGSFAALLRTIGAKAARAAMRAHKTLARLWYSHGRACFYVTFLRRDV